jgi:hypothetical protein
VPGVRGATFIDEDTPEAILAGTRELLVAIAQANGIASEDIASAFFHINGRPQVGLPGADGAGPGLDRRAAVGRDGGGQAGCPAALYPRPAALEHVAPPG